ncbi:hypothetical protein FRC10_011535 [Ceratobasidium sp. 414]|nr:hypothetical protein FRC10_011535 [Ceratobasidium sp. 414]
MSLTVLPATPVMPIKSALRDRPSIKSWTKDFNAKTLFELDDTTYRTVIADVKRLCITSGLDMTKPLGPQAPPRLHTLYIKALNLYPALANFKPPTWSVGALFRTILKFSTQQAVIAMQKARKIDQERRRLWAMVMVNNLSRRVPPPTFPLIFDLIGLPQLAWLLFEVLLDTPLPLWLWLSLTALRQLPLVRLPQPVPVFPPHFSLLAPTMPDLPQTTTVVVTLSTIPPCPQLTRQDWSLKLTVGREVTAMTAAGEVGDTSLMIVQALPLQLEALAHALGLISGSDIFPFSFLYLVMPATTTTSCSNDSRSTLGSVEPTTHLTSSHPTTSMTYYWTRSDAKASANTPATQEYPYYNHEDTAKMCARFITHLFSCPNVLPATSQSTVTPNLAHFVAYALHHTRLHSSVTFHALYLLSCLKSRFPTVRSASGHRLYISALLLASKVTRDGGYLNKTWCVVSQGMFTLREINQMEREMCGFLEWALNVKPEDLRDFEAMVRKEYGSASPTPALAAVPIELRKQLTADYANANPYPSPFSTPPSPSHSNSTSPASSMCQTPPFASLVKVLAEDVTPLEQSQPFVYATPSV